jgi:hypothetical protein
MHTNTLLCHFIEELSCAPEGLASSSHGKLQDVLLIFSVREEVPAELRMRRPAIIPARLSKSNTAVTQLRFGKAALRVCQEENFLFGAC